MEPITIVGGIAAGTGLGFGFGVGARLMRIRANAQRDLEQLRKRKDGGSRSEEQPSAPPIRAGRKRHSSIIGIYNNGAIRHRDGDYCCAWEANLQPTMLSHDLIIEARCDALARMLAVDKPPGTVIQFRF